MSATAIPSTIEVHKRPGELLIVWADGHQSRYSFRYLRGFCPCAECQGHAAGWTFQDRPMATVVEVKEVGSYAVNIVWTDGGPRPHTTGIYPFDTLRTLCPCADCVGEQGEAHASHLLPPTP